MNTLKYGFKIKIVFLPLFCFSCLYYSAFSQVSKKHDSIRKTASKTILKDSIKGNKKIDTILQKRDTTKTFVLDSSNKSSFQRDTVQQANETSAVDIASNRGLFIGSQDGSMQLRILGSVRSLMNYSLVELETQSIFNPYEIPMDQTSNSPNFYASVAQSRLGFEVTRKTKDMGDIFIRLEADFNGSNGAFRIRHAYGQINHLLVGKTWSMMSNVSFQPATVNRAGAPGSINLRTTQIRYNKAINDKMMWFAGIEYSTPDIDVPTEINGTILQVIPDFTGKYTYKSKRFSGNASVIITTISGKLNDSDKISYSFGLGGLVAGKYTINDDNHLFASFGAGRGISHFFRNFTGKGEDAAYNDATNAIKALVSSGGYVAYEHNLPYDLMASASFGILSISNLSYQENTDFSFLYETMLDAFWSPVDGARVGAELAFGRRENNDGLHKSAFQFSTLIYYDF